MSNEMTGLEALSLDFTAQVRERYERWLPERLAEVPESERDSFYSTLAEGSRARPEPGAGPAGAGTGGRAVHEAPGPVQHGPAPSDRGGLGRAAPSAGTVRIFTEDPAHRWTTWRSKLLHRFNPDDEGYEFEMESWRQYHRQKGNYVRTEPID